MKRFLSIFLSILIVIGCSVPSYAFAADNSEYDSEFTQEEFEALEHVYAVSIQPYASGLIVGHTLGIAKDNNDLLITGSTTGSSSVVKCGFTKDIPIQKTNADEIDYIWESTSVRVDVKKNATTKARLVATRTTTYSYLDRFISKIGGSSKLK